MIITRRNFGWFRIFAYWGREVDSPEVCRLHDHLSDWMQCYCTGIPVGALYLVCWTTRDVFCKIHLYYCVTMRQVIFQTSRSLVLSTYSWYMLLKLTNYRTWTADTNSTLDISFLLSLFFFPSTMSTFIHCSYLIFSSFISEIISCGFISFNCRINSSGFSVTVAPAVFIFLSARAMFWCFWHRHLFLDIYFVRLVYFGRKRVANEICLNVYALSFM